MTFDDMPAGSVVFVDANTFIYYFQPRYSFNVKICHIKFPSRSKKSFGWREGQER
jgi:hypothetical protein